jgi:predicted  nucleic acid-binding Zn-ribbon protein
VADARLRETGLQLDKTNGELELATEKTAQEENRLFAGGLSARDADYLRREVEMLRDRVSKMEDSVLELMEAREEAEQEAQRLSDEVAAAGQEKSRLEELIAAAWSEIDASIAIEEERKARLVPHVDPDLLALYEELRRSRDGAVVGELRDGVCTACNLKLSAAEENEARREDPARCIHCRAILVY